MRELGLTAASYALVLSLPFAAEILKDYSGVYYLYDSRIQYILNTIWIIGLISLLLACLTQLARRFQRIVFFLLMFFFSVLGMLALIHVLLYDAPISVGAVDALLGTDLREAMEYLGFHWTLRLALAIGGYWLLFAFLLGFAWPRLSHDGPCPLSHAAAGAVLAVLVVLAYQFPAVAVRNQDRLSQRPLWSRAAELNHQLPSLRILYDIGEWMEFRQWLEETGKIREGQEYNAVLRHGPKPRTIVLVIGESLRRNRMSLYGYPLPTTPHLDARRQQLLVFESAISPSNQTVPSLTKMLTPATVRQPDLFLTKPSILAAAKKAGYHTYWLSNQGRVGPFDSLISLIANDADTLIYTNTEFYGSVLDEALLHPLEVILREPDLHKFIVIHTLGSHQNYRNRYPSHQAYFDSEDYAGEEAGGEEAVVQSEYDNSVRYSDGFLEQILGRLEKQSGSVLLFVSDHGERLYENGIATCGHGFPDPTRTEFDVPYFLWCNGACPKRWQRAAARYHDLPFNTENLFHTLADVLGLEMVEYSPKKDILNPKYRPEGMPQIIDVNRGVHTYSSLP